ncbi:hypothetical protein N1851_017129 [Merluccius polli]|uniref:Uncharacterized protein n=1 Tax=Merluccius polli TaxID=89951 RepID=A0AA47P118_MERPO|nr:hypothetical protein N1851_017129 [Merluccius polli]
MIIFCYIRILLSVDIAKKTCFTFHFVLGSKEQTELLIKLRSQNDLLFTGAKHSTTVGWRTILEKMGLEGKDCKYPGTGEGTSGKPTAANWPWFVLMDEALGQRPSIAPPVVIASMPEDTPGPSAAGDEEEESQPGPSRKRRREDDLFSLIKEDMRLQREAEERREQESKERMERLFSLLEKIQHLRVPQSPAQLQLTNFRRWITTEYVLEQFTASFDDVTFLGSDVTEHIHGPL